jgi:predicted transcriptional regulator
LLSTDEKELFVPDSKIEKLTKAGLDVKKAPAGAVDVLAAMSEQELQLLAKIQKQTHRAKEPAVDDGFGGIIF